MLLYKENHMVKAKNAILSSKIHANTKENTNKKSLLKYVIKSHPSLNKEILNFSSFVDIEPNLKTSDDYQNIISKRNPKFTEEFSLDELISKGSYGVILKGLGRKIKKNFAFKFIFNKRVIHQEREKCLKRIRNEISIQYKLRNKNINQFFGFYEIADTFCYVLEHEKFGDLSNFMKILKRPVLTESLMAFISLQILQALDYCHKNKIAHLDIKKQNVLVDEDLNIKLCDFSVSTEYNTSDIRLHRVGSSLYISPKNLNKDLIHNVNINKIDVYSFGVLLYNLAFKEFPYELLMTDGQNFDVITKKIKENNLNIPVSKSHSENFRDFLRKVLENDINRRLSITEAFEHNWIKAARLILDEKKKYVIQKSFLSCC